MKKIKTLFLASLIAALCISLAVPVAAKDEVWQGLSKRFYIFGSVQDNYSGPAAVKAVLHYDSACTCEQKQIAEWTKTTDKGTKLADIVDTLNKRISKHKLDVYNSDDFDTVIYSLYDTVVRKDVPAIIGVKADTKQGWAYDMDRSRYVLIYAVSSDLKSFKVADPLALQRSENGIPHFYTVSAAALYDAYLRANTGLSYVLNREAPDAGTVPANSPSLLVSPEIGSLSQEDAFTYQIVNNTGSPLHFGSPFSLQRYLSASKSWEEVKPDTADGFGFVWTAIWYELPAGSTAKFSFSLKGFAPGPGIYRLVKTVSSGEQQLTLESNAFALTQ